MLLAALPYELASALHGECRQCFDSLPRSGLLHWFQLPGFRQTVARQRLSQVLHGLLPPSPPHAFLDPMQEPRAAQPLEVPKQTREDSLFLQQLSLLL